MQKHNNGTAASMMKKADSMSTCVQSGWTAVILACFSFACCYFRSFVSGNVPVLFWGDQLGFATNGSRMLAGQLPYRDYFDFLTPGTELVYAFLFKLFGVSLWIPNLVMACLAATTVLLMTLLTRRLVRGAFVVLPGLLFAGFVLYGAADATHHWFSTVVVMAAVLILFDGTTLWRIAGAGALCGLVASFTQSKGAAVVVGFMIYLAWISWQETGRAGATWRRCLLLCGMALAVFAAINARFIHAAGMGRWIECVIVFPIRYYPSVPINSWHGTWTDFHVRTGILKWVCFPFMYAVVPLVYFVVLGIMRREWKRDRSEHWNQLLLVAITGLMMFLGVAPALAIKRISSVSPPAMTLLAWLLSRNGRKFASAAVGLGAVSLVIAVALAVRAQMRSWTYLDLPAGRAAIPDPAEVEVYRWMAAHTRPGQMYFGMPPMYLPFRLQNPTPIDSPAPSEYGRPEQIALAIEDLEKNHVPMLLLRRSMYIPHLLGYPADHLQPFQNYLFANYRCTKTFSTGDEVWERLDPRSRVQ